jgi:peptide/nickel transport system ATP-binding protein
LATAQYAGRIVEEGSARELLHAPRHSYTLGLLHGRAHGAMARGQRLKTIAGSPRDLSRLPPGCAFAERCGYAQPAWREAQPAPVRIAPGQFARCLRTDATAVEARALAGETGTT